MSDNSAWDEEESKKRTANGQFKAGASGNPKGRPRKKRKGFYGTAASL